MRPVYLLASCAVLAFQAHAQGFVTVELQPVGVMLKTMGLVAMPPTWQSSVLPGSVIYVDRRQGAMGGCAHLPSVCIIKNKYIIPTPSDVPKEKVEQPGTIDVGKLNSMGSTDVGISVLVGKFAPSLDIEKQSHIDYAQSHFTSKGWGPAILTSASVVSDSVELQHDLTLGVVDGKDSHGRRAWRYFGRGYLVTSVVYATDLQVATDANFKLSASLQKASNGGCTEDKLVSLLKGDTTDSGTTPAPTSPSNPSASTNGTAAPQTPATIPAAAPTTTLGSTTDTVKPKSTTPSEAKSTIDSANASDTGTKTEVLGASPDLQATVKICSPKQGIYTLHVTPGIPIAFSAIPLIFDPQTNLPKVEPGDLEALHKALEKPDNQ